MSTTSTSSGSPAATAADSPCGRPRKTTSASPSRAGSVGSSTRSASGVRCGWTAPSRCPALPPAVTEPISISGSRRSSPPAYPLAPATATVRPMATSMQGDEWLCNHLLGWPAPSVDLDVSVVEPAAVRTAEWSRSGRKSAGAVGYRRAVRIVDLDPGDPRPVVEVLPVLRELRTQLTAESLVAVYAEAHPQGLRFTAAYDEAGTCVGVAGWRIVATTTVGRKLYVDDLVTSASRRSTGVSRALLAELVGRARAAGCSLLDLDSSVQRHAAHRFYFREGLHISSHHFARPVRRPP